jgi:hypothetical protein
VFLPASLGCVLEVVHCFDAHVHLLSSTYFSLYCNTQYFSRQTEKYNAGLASVSDSHRLEVSRLEDAKAL